MFFLFVPNRSSFVESFFFSLSFRCVSSHDLWLSRYERTSAIEAKKNRLDLFAKLKIKYVIFCTTTEEQEFKKEMEKVKITDINR